MQAHTFSDIFHKIRLQWVIPTLFIGITTLYVFFVINTAYLIADKRSIEVQIANTRNELTALESLYIDVSGRINIGLAHRLGFVDSVKNTRYITRTSGVTAFVNGENGF